MKRHFFMGTGRFPTAEGVAAPSGLDGSPTLVASWDFDRSDLITLSGGDIDQIAGADGTSFTLLTPGNMPAQTTRGSKKVADFASASSEYMQIASALGITDACTVVVVAELKTASPSANETLFDLSNGASATFNNRYWMFGASGPFMNFRRADGTANSSAIATHPSAAIHLLIGGIAAAPTERAYLNIDGVGTAVQSGTVPSIPTGLSHFTLGACRASGAQSNFGNHYKHRVLVYSSHLSATAKEQIATWASTNYATSNVA